MGNRRIIAVVGATGTQGGSVARAILHQAGANFEVRAITRKPSGDRARSLAREGAEIVYGDVDDLASMRRAFTGVYGAYCMTDFWGGHGDPERERVQGTTMAEAAQCAGVQHVVWSTLEDTRRFISISDSRMLTLLGKYKVPHFDGKGEADEAFVRRGVPTTFFLTSFYWENFYRFPGMELRPRPEGNVVLSMPMADKKLPGIAVDDIGLCALGVFNEPCTIGETIGIAGEHLTCEQIAASLSDALGRTVRYVDVEPTEFASWNFPAAAELSNMLQFKRDFQEAFCGARSVDRSRQLNPALQTFDAWLTRHADEFSV